MFAGTENGNIWVRSGQELNWFLATTGLPEIESLASDSTYGINYAGTVNGLYRSLNGGSTWTKIAFSGYSILDLEINERTGQTFCVIYKETSFPDLNIGIHVSTNQGSSWSAVYTGIYCRDVYVTDDNALLAACGDGIIRFTPGSGSGLGSPGSVRYCVAAHPGGYIFAGTNEGLFRRTYPTGSFVNVLPTSSISAWIYTIFVDKNGYVYAGSSGEGIFRSTDTGLTWHAFNSGIIAYEEILDQKTSFSGYLFAAGFNGSAVYESVNPVNPPAIVKLLSPPYDTTGIISDLALDWDTALTTKSYTIQIAEDTLFSNFVLHDSLISVSNYQLGVSLLQSNTTYWWRVQGTNIVGKGEWSKTGKFTTGVLVGVEDEDSEKNNSKEFIVSIWPNPSKSVLNISFKTESEATASIRIFNTLGEAVYSEQNIPLAKGVSTRSIFHNLSAGIYILKATTNSPSGENSIFANKILIMK
jgi:hypothetical protein